MENIIEKILKQNFYQLVQSEKFAEFLKGDLSKLS